MEACAYDSLYCTITKFSKSAFFLYLCYGLYYCKQEAQLSQRDCAAGCVIVLAKSR